ncbi:hypothetical protein VTK73DRAFT_7147 [Phialemonium thermophilum]|uniref:Uncharacterized protein n=1 Tax=Phialemonium thermophilum TaxID=223376 RepID=A0ABR3WG43_9PEZI
MKEGLEISPSQACDHGRCSKCYVHNVDEGQRELFYFHSCDGANTTMRIEDKITALCGAPQDKRGDVVRSLLRSIDDPLWRLLAAGLCLVSTPSRELREVFGRTDSESLQTSVIDELLNLKFSAEEYEKLDAAVLRLLTWDKTKSPKLQVPPGGRIPPGRGCTMALSWSLVQLD